MKKIATLLILIISFAWSSYGQAGLCEDSEPFCTSDTYTFPAGVNTGTAQSGANYGCLATRPNPAWYHMRIATSGDIRIHMFSQPSRDIDYICWGPFTDPHDPCVSQLTGNMEVDCSYSTAASEYCYIPNGQVGEYYILLITNYSNLACDITFEKTSGSGETDCTIIPPPVSNNGPLCVGDNLQLYADDVNNATYHWTGPNGFSSSQQNPIILNVGMQHAGAYNLVITVNGSPSDPVTTIVAINALPTPNFDFNNACFGETNYFTDQSTVEPITATITSWSWQFGDGQQGAGPNQEHVYGNVGNYNVVLTTSTGFNQCTRSISQTVTVFSSADVDAGSDVTIPNGWETQLDGQVGGGSGDYDLIWEPQNLLVDPTELDPATVPLSATEVFKLNVTDASSGCISADSMTVIVTGGALGVTATASPMVICQDEIVNLTALPSGGSGNNTFSWTSDPAGFTADIADPSDFPQETTTYSVSVFDGQNTVNASIQVVVKPRPIGNAGPDMTIAVGTSTTISAASASAGSGDYTYLWTPVLSLINATDIHPQTTLLDESTEFTFLVNDNNGCSSILDNMHVFAGGDVLNVSPTSSAINNTICQGDEVDLFPNAMGGGGTYTYLWTDEQGLSSTQESINVSPWETTTYTIEVNDSFKIVSNEITVHVNHTPVVDLVPDNIPLYAPDTIKVCVRDSVLLNATDPINPPLMNYIWSTSANSPTIIGSTNGNWIAFETYWVDVENPVTYCSGMDTITVFFDFDECSIGINENELSKHIAIKPNPAKDYTEITINGTEGKVQISLLSIQGKSLWRKEAIVSKSEPFSQTIQLSNLPKGIYVVNVVHKLGVFNSRIIKQ